MPQIEAILLFEGNMHVWIREKAIRERRERIAAEDLILDHPGQDEEGSHAANGEHGPKPGFTGTALGPNHDSRAHKESPMAAVYFAAKEKPARMPIGTRRQETLPSSQMLRR